MGSLKDYINSKYNKNEEEKEQNVQNSSLSNYINEKYRKQEANSFGLDTLESDINTLATNIQKVYDGWQTEETLNNTRSSIEAMQNRITAYQNWQKEYGDGKGADLTELSNNYKSMLENFDELYDTYGKYDSADAYKKAIKEADEAAKIHESKKTANLKVVQTEIDDLQKILDTAKSKKPKTNLTTSARKGRGAVLDTQKRADEQKLLDDYLKSVGYSSVEDIEKALGEKKAYKKSAEYIQGKMKLSTDAITSENFDDYVKSGSGLNYEDFGDGNYTRAGRGRSVYVEDKYRIAGKAAYDYFNGDVTDTGAANDANTYSKYRDLMTEDEFKTFAYYREYDKQNGTTLAYDYIDSIEEDLNIRYGNRDYEKMKDKSALAKVLYGVPAGLDQFASGIENAFNFKDEYIPTSSTQVTGQLIRDDLSNDGFKLFGTSIGQIGYDLTQTTANMLPSILASSVSNALLPGSGAVVGATLMGTSAAGNSYQQMLNQGYDKSQARTYGTLVGVAEAGLQYAFGGISKLGGKLTGKTITSIANGVDNALGRFAIKYGLNMASEGFEEAAQEILNPFFENLALGYSKNDLTDIEWGEVAYSGALGALSAGFLEGGSTAVSTFSENASAKKTGANIRGNNQISGMLDIASLSQEETDAYNLYTQYANKGVNAENISDLQLGRLHQMAGADAQSVLSSKKSTTEEIENAKNTLNDLAAFNQNNSAQNMGKKNINALYGDKEGTYALIEEGLESGENTESYKLATELKAKMDKGEKITTDELAKLADANTSAYKGEIKTDAEARLTELGETNASELSEIIVKKSNGEILTNAEKETLQKNKNATKVYNEINNEDLVANTENMSEGEANLILSTYDDSISVDSFMNSYNLVKSYATNRFSNDYVLEHRGKLTPTQVSAIYSHFVTDKDAKTQKMFDDLKLKHKNAPFQFGKFDDSVIDYNNSGAEGKVNWNDLNDDQKNAITIVGTIAQQSGLDVELIIDGYERGINGAFEISGNKILIDVYAGMDKVIGSKWDNLILPTLSHEMTHWMEEKAPELYRKYSDYVMQTLVQSTNKTEDKILDARRRLLEKKHPGQKFTDDYVRREVIARASEDMLGKSEVIKGFLDTLPNAEKKTFVEKVKEILQKLKDWFNSYLAKNSSKAAEAKVIRETSNRIDGQIKLWDEMLKSAIETNQALKNEGIKAQKNTTEGDVRFALREDAKTEVKTALTNKHYNQEIKLTDSSPSILLAQKGVKNLPMMMKASHIRENIFTEEEAKKKGFKVNKNINYHGLGEELFYKVIDGLDEVKEAYRGTKNAENSERRENYFLLISQYTDKDGNIINVPVYINEKGLYNRVFIDTNKIATVFGKNEFRKYIREQLNKGNLVRIKNRSIQTSESTSPINADYGENTSKDSIHQNNPKSQEQIQNSDRDSLGNTLTEAQQSYFAESKVRDENGNLMVMYHGSPKTDISSFRLDLGGAYFTSNPEYAKEYGRNGKVYEVYLNITKPFDTRNAKDRALFEKEFYGKWGNGAPITEKGLPDWTDGDDLIDFLQEKGYDYDGLILDEGGVPTDSGVKDRGISYVVFDKANQVKYTDNLNPTPNENMQFSLREDVEETKELVAVHNLTEEKLLKSLQLGGLPMPSIAIIKAREGHSTFGKISLVFSKNTIDPSLSRSNKVYSGDAWTPTYPSIDYKVSKDVVYNAQDKIDDLLAGTDYKDAFGYLGLDTDNVSDYLNRNGGNIYNAYGDKPALKLAYLKDKGIELNLPQKQVELSNRFDNGVVIKFAEKYGEEKVKELNGFDNTKLFDSYIPEIKGIVEDYYSELMGKKMDWEIGLHDVYDLLDASLKYFRKGIKNKTDTSSATRQMIDEAVDEVDYKNWFDNLFNGVIEKEGIRNNADTFTPSGNRRSFEALHYEHNLENVIKAMKDKGTKGIGVFGSGNIFGAATTEYGSIAEIKDDANNRMQNMTDEEYEAIKQGFSNRFFELADSLPIHKDSFSATDDAANMLIEAVSKFKTKSGMANYIRKESQGWATYSDYVVDDLIELVNDIRNMPVGYFEAKPQRAVGFDEVATAIIPNNASAELKQRLNDNGVKFVEYESGNEDARLKALNSLEDVQFSDRDDVNVYDLMGENQRLIKENEKIKADVERLNEKLKIEKERLKIERQVTHGNYFNTNQINAVAGHLRKIANTTYDKVELMKELRDYYSYISHSDELNWEDVFSKAYSIAKNMLAERKEEVYVNDYFKEMLKDFRTTPISLNENQIGDAKYLFGNDYHRFLFQKFNLRKDGKSLDLVWKENWAPKYGFDTDISDTEIVSEMYKKYEEAKQGAEIVAEYNEEETTRWLANEIYNQFWNVSPIRTTADKYDKQIKRLTAEHRNAMRELRENYDNRLAEQKKAGREKYQKLAQEIRERKDKEIAEVKKLGQERMAKYKENAERKTKIQSITANSLTLNKWLTTNSKDYHIHENMKAPVIALLNAIDFSSKRMLDKNYPTQKDIYLSKALSKVKDMMADATNLKEGLEELYGHDMDDELKSLAESVDNIMRTVGDNEYVLNRMSLEELQTLDKLVRTIKHAVTKVNKFHTVHHNRGVYSLANTFIEHGEKLGELKKQDGKIAKHLKFRNCTPYYFFKRLGEAGEILFEAFQDGWDKLAFNSKQIIDFTNEVYTDKEVRNWTKETKNFTVKLTNGKTKTFEMSVAQIMALHCVSKQKDAQNHLFDGGMTLSRFDKKGNVVATYKNIPLSVTDLGNILSTLTDRQKEVADKLQEFMNTVCSDWGNEISMARFGVKMFGLPDYFPIKVSPAELPQDNTNEVENVSLFRLLNMSFTKTRKPEAKQSIEIGDIFDVFAQHTTDMAKYNALALPVLDFNKFYFITGKNEANEVYGVKSTLMTVFGIEANEYARRFVRDINGSQNVSRDAIGKTFFKNAKVAAVAANLRVVLLQPTAFFKASAVLDNKYLIKAGAYMKVNPISMKGKFEKAIAKAEKYCGIVQWKALGYYDTDISKGIAEKVKHADGFKDKVIENSLKGAELADKLTFGTLWTACEFEIRDTRKDLNVGSDEFYQAVAKRLREVVYATQVVDSTMTRTDMMRSSDTFDKMLTTFGSEPAIAYNMLMDMAMQFGQDKKILGKKEAWKKNGKKIRKVIASYVLVNAVAALVESGFDVYRDDDDEEDELGQFMGAYLKNFALDMSIGNKLPIVKELYTIMQGYSSSRMDTQWAVNLVSGANTWLKIFSGEGEGKGDKAIKDILKAFSNLSGFAFYNLYRDLMATLYNLGILDKEDIENLFS